MTVAEELYRMGIPKEQCESVAKTLIDSAASSGQFDRALESMLCVVKMLTQKENSRRLANYSAGLLKK